MTKMNTLFALEEYVTYRKNGVCRIEDITVQNFGGQGKKEYYVLRSVYDQNMKLFVPLGSELEKEMKRILSVDEVHEIIKETEKITDLWVADCKSRALLFDEIVNSGDKAKLIWIVKAVAEYKLEVEAQKKKMKANDLKYSAIAESIISGEFAFVLGIPRNEVMAYINDYLNK